MLSGIRAAASPRAVIIEAGKTAARQRVERSALAARPRRDGTAARRGLAASARNSTRWRAAVFPASMMTALGEAAARIPDSIAALRSRHRR